MCVLDVLCIFTYGAYVARGVCGVFALRRVRVCIVACAYVTALVRVFGALRRVHVAECVSVNNEKCYIR